MVEQWAAVPKILSVNPVVDLLQSASVLDVCNMLKDPQ